MVQMIEAIYEDKVLKPLTPIEGLREHQRVEITMVIANGGVDKRQKQISGYDFSDIAGKLQWQGDALVEQRKLRDEW